MADASTGAVLKHIRRIAHALHNQNQTDGDLLRAFIAQNDQQAFAVLVKRHGPLVLTVCRRVLDSQQDAEDAFQATFLLLALGAGSLRKAESLAGWLHAAALRTSLNARRAAGRRRKHEGRAVTKQPVNAANDVEWREVLVLLDEEIRQLPDHYREPFVLCCLEQQDCAEAARELGLKKGTVWSRLSEARRRLRARLTRRGIELTSVLAVIAICEGKGLATVPAALSVATVKAASLIGAGGAITAGVVPARIVSMVMGAKKTMILTKAAYSTALLLASGLVCVGLSFADNPQTPAVNSENQVREAPQNKPVVASRDKNTNATPGEPAPGSLSGRVLDSNGRPLAGARVWFELLGNKPVAETMTDREGRFKLVPLPSTKRQARCLLVEAQGLTRQYVLQPTIFPGADHAIGDIVVHPGKCLQGRVFDVDGKPLSRAKVSVILSRMVLGHTYTDVGASYDVETADDGRFRTPPLPVGRVTITVQQPDRITVNVRLSVVPSTDETLEPIRLEKDVPLVIQVRDEEGNPIAGAGIQAHLETSDTQGQIVLRGYGEKRPLIALQVWKAGYTTEFVALVNPTVTLKKTGFIAGRAIDADTGQPVRLKDVLICQCERQPNGEIVIKGCLSGGLEQREPGPFRIPYSAFSEFRLTAYADGYLNSETFVPKITDPAKVDEVVVKMRKKQTTSADEPAGLQIRGRVTRRGQPVKLGWAVLWGIPRMMNVPNAHVLRGRTTCPDGVVYAETPLHEGSYVLSVPNPGKNWYISIEEPGEPPTIVGPLEVTDGERKTLDSACADGGSVRGRVKNLPKDLVGQLWVVAFTDFGYRTETRVQPDGSFHFRSLPPGKYGLKIGHDAYHDSDTQVPGNKVGEKPTREEMDAIIKAQSAPADPWKRAKVVQVETGKDRDAGELELP